ncbi:MAG: 3,4-dihydroxy-2-butanone-4-phosphate synthase [Variovorax paradoxus]|nr:3,4-dihydroxy-2-butanone-4-phosphate synthase [Variovorax paradoxus]MBW8717659.1 3,4-dihydroxy-2-butanone-4-phosphate synthase [Variovorax paradoxus]
MNASVTPIGAPRGTRAPAPISSVEEIVAELAAGRMVILVDEEDRENEGDIVIAADHITPEAINFMARHARGLICLTLSREMCERLQLPPMVSRNGAKHSTAFTVSNEAAEGVTTGISAADRARTVQAAVARNAVASDLVQPGHIFPLQAVDGGVLMRAGHTEAGCDLAAMAGCSPASVICEVMNFPLQAVDGGVLMRAGHTEAGCDLAAMAGCSPASVICEVMNEDGTMARLPDLQLFAAEHGLKIGTIAALIEHRSRTESLVEKVGCREIQTAWGSFTAHAFTDKPSRGVHLALVRGKWSPEDTVSVRVHEPLSVLDALEINRSLHSWSLDASLAHIANEGKGVAVLLNCGETAGELLAQFDGTARPAQAPERGRMDLRSYGIGAQILRECGVHKMNLLGTPRRMPSMAAGYGLEIAGYLTKD